MGKLLKGVSLIGCGLIVGSAITGYSIITSDIFLTGLKTKIVEGIEKWLYGEDSTEKRKRIVGDYDKQND